MTTAESAPPAGPAMPRVLTGGRRRIFGALMVNGLAQAAAAVGTAVLVQYAFDQLLAAQRETRGELLVVAVGLPVAAALTAFLRARERVDAERLGQRFVHAVRLVLFGHVVTTSPRSLQRRSQGGTLLRFVGDLNALRQWVSLGLSRLAVAGVMVVGTVGALAVASPALALAVGGAVLLGAAAAVYQGNGLQEAVRTTRRRRGRLARNVNEKLQTVAVVQAFGQVEPERQLLSRQSKKLSRAMVARARVVGRLRAVTEATGALATAVVLVTGAAVGEAPGTVAGAMTIVALLVAQLRDLNRCQEYWHGHSVAITKVREVLDRPTALSDEPGLPDLVPGPGRLEFRDVGLDEVLDGVSVVAEAGARVAVVGPNGAGKSTLLTVAARLVDPERGAVLLDGQDLAGSNLASVRRSLGLAGPDLPLLRGSLEANLTYRWPDAPPEEVRRVRDLCALDDLVGELTDGDETRVAEGGVSLSAGQRQRIALGRALLGEPPVLLLDEADANLDQRAREVLDHVVAAHRGTVLVVTHRLEQVRNADVVWCMEGGRLVEAGSPEELLHRDGPTARLLLGERRAAA